jgi:hypothetical protein
VIVATGLGLDLAAIVAAVPDDLFVGIVEPVEPDHSVGISVIDVTHDSRQVGAGTLFACVVGDHAD